MIKTRGHSTSRLHQQGPGRKACWLAWALGGLLLLGPIRSQAGPVLSTDSPVGFFTNAAIRLLMKAGYTVGPPMSTSNLLVTNFVSGLPITSLRIPIWPTNFYTPSVHRLLQLAANLYDATTNRTDSNYPSAYPYLPTAFRPVFSSGGKASSQISIVGYQEVTPADTPTFLSSIRPHDLSDPNDRLVKPFDMVYNVPLVIGAKKGLPSFDEFSMDTQIRMARKLIFHRPGTSTTAQVNEIDPEYLLSVSNVVGLQVWNSYAATYSRSVTLQAWPDTSFFVANMDTGALLNPPEYPSRLPATAPSLVYSSWPGYNATFPSSSFITPLGSPTTNYIFMPTNCVYSFSGQRFVVNGLPDRTPGLTNYHIPHFQVTLKARLRFTLVDQQTRRLIDYVNLATNQTVDITAALMGGGCGNSYSPVYSKDRMWCTNLLTGVKGADPNLSFGVRLQLDVSSGLVLGADWTSSLPDPLYGQDKDKGIARFLTQFGLGLGNYPMLNTFPTPYQPLRNIHLVTLWQANDSLVHYTAGDLNNTTDFPEPFCLDQLPFAGLPPTAFGTVNDRYEPWGGNPIRGSGSPTKYDLTVKDPVAVNYANSDNWDFPTNQTSGASWLGRVHRGTPWQTIYLKAPGTTLGTWVHWTGNSLLVTNFGQLSTTLVPLNGVIYDACLTYPTNDWRLAAMLASLLSTNALRQFLSANQTSVPAWEGALDGMVVLTNNEGPDPPDGLVSLIMFSNSPQAATIASAILTTRSTQPNQSFQDPGDVLSTPELSVASPWLDTSSTDQLYYALTDEAYEAIPSQLLPLLRADSVGSVVQSGGRLQIQFSGSDGLAYAVQVSSDLLHWTSLTTNYPVAGVISFAEVPPPGAPRHFFRSLLLP